MRALESVWSSFDCVKRATSWRPTDKPHRPRRHYLRGVPHSKAHVIDFPLSFS
jgi:hypothetical protein